MARIFASSAALALLCGTSAASAVETTPSRENAPSLSASNIKNVIVIMFENRAFDHFLGHLGLNDTRVNGVSTAQSNPLNPADPASAVIHVAFDAPDGGPSDPKHDFNSVTQQIYGFAAGPNNKTAVGKMNGFVVNAVANARNFVMSAFNDSSLPVLSTLAREFAVFDAWHCRCGVGLGGGGVPQGLERAVLKGGKSWSAC